MKTSHRLLAVSLGLLSSYSAQAQLSVGGTIPTAARAGTMLDVNGPIASYETTVAATGTTAPTAAIIGNVGQVQLATGTATAGPITVSYVNAPTAGQRLVVYNNATYAATFNNQNIPAAQAVEFIYSGSNWRACGDGGSSAAATNGLTKTGGTTSLGGTLTGVTTIASAGYSLAFSGAGYLGLGTSAPGEKLEVSGNIRLGSEPATATTGWGNYLEFDGDGVNSDIIGLARYNASVAGGGSSEMRLVLGDDGNVGPGNGKADRFLIGTTTNCASPGLVTLGTFTPNFYVYSSGAVGIGGDASATSMLNVTGAANVTGNHSVGGITFLNNGVVIKSTGQPALSITTTTAAVGTTGANTGAVNIYYDSPGNENHVFGGNIVPDANGNRELGASGARWTTVWAVNSCINTSDSRLKTNIKNSVYGLKDVLRMRPVTYNWKTEPTTNQMVGFIAQEMAQIVPEAVVAPKTAGEYYGMKYTELVPVLTKAIQEQQVQIEALQVANAELQAQVAELQNVKNSLRNLVEQVRRLQVGGTTANTK